MSNIIIVGGGVSGVVTAIRVANSKNNIIILERNDKLLKKLLLTGNGRCNYFNEDRSINNFHSSNMDILEEIINNKNLDKILDFYDYLGIIPRIKNGYYYPYSNQASSVRDILLDELNKKNIFIRYNYLVKNIEKRNDKFIINNELECDKLVVSTGSYAYPKTGSDGSGYGFLEKLSHNIIKVLPSLVQLKSNSKYNKKLSGVRSEVEVSLYENNKFVSKEQGEIQFTDYGLSGICIFNLSYYISRGLFKNSSEVIYVNFLPFIKNNVYDWFNDFSMKHVDKNIFSLLEGFLNIKVVNVILDSLNINSNSYYKDLDINTKNKLIDCLTKFKFNIIGTLDFNHSQVCSGGISLKEINTFNLESKFINNLYITGELLDITGNCGGYNLENAVLSGILVGDDLCDKS